ncbi:MAG: PLP-dependent aminotransferase family protein [Nitrospirota bacterium]|nr:PLP-dependent aminotransferase family protein [Nitrospirota bacterium]
MYTERIGGLKSSAIREILKITSRPGVISFAGGLPAPELFPLEDIASAAQEVFAKYSASVLQYSVTEGLRTLREKISLMLEPDASLIGPSHVIITQGSQQGLDLLSKLFLEKGRSVFTENPSYLGALQAFQLFQADILPIASDRDGIQPESLRRALKVRRPALVYIMPNFQNPTGVSLSMERRLQLVDIVKEHDLLLVEDDPYGDLIFSGEKMPSLFTLGGTRNFIYMSSFSKTIAPGMRVAYLAGSEEIIGKLAVVKQGTDLQTNTLGQYLVNEYLESGRYYGHRNLLRETYKQRRDCMLSSMESYFPGSLSWNCPEGGMFLWVRLPEHCDAREILLKCLERNVAFVPGQEFFPDGSGKNTIRLNFSNALPDKIEEGIKRIGEVLKESNI